MRRLDGNEFAAASKLVSPKSSLPVPRKLDTRRLTSAEFSRLQDVPAEAEWFANLESPGTRRIYKTDIRDFMHYVGIQQALEFRLITRAHVIAYRDELARRKLQGATIRRKLAALSSLYAYLCDRNAVAMNPVKGVKRPKIESYEGKTPAISDAQVRLLMEAPKGESLKALRDRAIISILFYHALRRDELCKLMVKDVHERRGVKHLRVHGKGTKIRQVPLHPASQERIAEYLQAAGHGSMPSAPLFRPIRNNRHGTIDTALTTDGVYQLIKMYGKRVAIAVPRFGPHAARATAATNALDAGADIAKVQEWLGHANVSTTRVYDHRKLKPEDSPTFKVKY
jgi:site-specific recombinase XerD